VLRLLATGRRNDEIARLLVVSAATVRKHLEHVYDKLGVGTRTAAVALAFPDGLSGDGSSTPARTGPRKGPSSGAEIAAG
jgi:hypothetical protein